MLNCTTVHNRHSKQQLRIIWRLLSLILCYGLMRLIISSLLPASALDSPPSQYAGSPMLEPTQVATQQATPTHEPIATRSPTITAPATENTTETIFISLAIQFVSALIAVVLGIPGGLYVNRLWSAKQNENALRAATASIRAELQNNQRNLRVIASQLEDLGAPPFPVIQSNSWFISQTSLQAAGPGRFELYRDLAAIYDRLDFLRRMEDTLWNMYFSPMRVIGEDYFAKAEKLLTESIRDVAKEIITQIDTILPDLEKR